jgi:1,4-alpha-glucan branching enzyme
VNTDAATYTGSGVGNLGSVTAIEGQEGSQPSHATLVLPPLATIWLRRG